MPLKEIKYKDEMLDGRRKLSTTQKEEISNRYKLGGVSMRKLAEQYSVSKRLILITVNPESAQKVKDRIKLHWKDYQGSKEYRNEAMRKFRAKKRYLGMITWKTDRRYKEC